MERRDRDECAEREEQHRDRQQDEMDTATIRTEHADEEQRQQEDSAVQRHVQPRRDILDEVEPLLQAASPP